MLSHPHGLQECCRRTMLQEEITIQMAHSSKNVAEENVAGGNRDPDGAFVWWLHDTASRMLATCQESQKLPQVNVKFVNTRRTCNCVGRNPTRASKRRGEQSSKRSGKMECRTAMKMAIAGKSHPLCNSLLLPPTSSLPPSFSNQNRIEMTKRRPLVAAPRAQFYLKPPPYPLDALEPYMSKKTLEVHWGKHHQTYVDSLNKQIMNTDFERYTLEDLVKVSYNNGNPRPVFNNAAQVWNHDFFWDTLRPQGGNKPNEQVLDRIIKQFGSYETFVEDFKHAATTLFGSGWIWLSLKRNKELVVEKTFNAVNPLVWNQLPLLALDVWEHAYYLDFQNERRAYIDTFFNNLVNWDAVENRLERAKGFVGLGEINIPSVESIQEREKISSYE